MNKTRMWFNAGETIQYLEDVTNNKLYKRTFDVEEGLHGEWQLEAGEDNDVVQDNDN